MLESYGNHKAFADKAREQASSFSSSVIEKVIADHQIKASLVADDITPLLPQLSAEIAAVQEAKAGAEGSKAISARGSRSWSFVSSSVKFQTTSSNRSPRKGGACRCRERRVGAVGRQLAELQAAMDKWIELSGASVESAPAVPAEESDEADPVVDSILPGFEDADVGDERGNRVMLTTMQMLLLQSTKKSRGIRRRRSRRR